jgi:hypothetical protein
MEASEMKKPWFAIDLPDLLGRDPSDDDGDGQSFSRVYGRSVKNGFEYALATFSDDGELVSWVECFNGRAKLHE